MKQQIKNKISKERYERAKRIVSEYEAQFPLSVVSRSFTIDDFEILSGTISIPSLTMKVVDEDFVASLEEKLEGKGYSIDFISLDDMGYISIHYRGQYQQITDKHIEDLLLILNNNETNE